MSLRRNVLIFHSGALGDFVLSWPLALAFGRLFAQSRIFYVATKGKGLLADRALRIESVDVESGWHELFAEQPNLPTAALKLLSGAHAVASFVADDKGYWEQNVRALAPHAEVHCLPAHPPADWLEHHTAYLIENLQPAVVWKQGVIQILSSLNQRGLGLTANPAGPVLIHPGSGSPTKCWPIEWYIELAHRMRLSGRSVAWVIGEVEAERWRAEQIRALSAEGIVHQPQSPVKLYDLLTTASAFVGNDSGPGHLAGILGLPVLTLFGPTDPAVWRPIGPRVVTLREHSLQALSVSQVEASVRNMLSATA